jgi:Ca2+-transporting ATPase
MTEENLLVRVLGSCETMANASVVCTDKTGTLTQNSMSVVAGSLGIHAKFASNLKDNKARMNAADKNPNETDFWFEQSELGKVLSDKVKKLLNDSIAINSTAFEDTDVESGEKRFVGSKTETALLNFAKDAGWDDYRKVRDGADIVEMIPFSSDRKAMSVVVKVGDNKWRLFLNGASEILTRLCTRHVVVPNPDSASGSDEGEEIQTVEIDEVAKDDISRTITSYANLSLRTIALCYRDFESWPPSGVVLTEEKEVCLVFYFISLIPMSSRCHMRTYIKT